MMSLSAVFAPAGGAPVNRLHDRRVPIAEPMSSMAGARATLSHRDMPRAKIQRGDHSYIGAREPYFEAFRSTAPGMQESADLLVFGESAGV
jgi:hypothetical protein